tara:strand:- start:152 stop:415 length:264 start_codon:yes stop_codon:yes gene_type:complete
MELYNDLKDVTDCMTYKGWRYIKQSNNHIILNRKFFELEQINIEFKDKTIYFSLPLKNSVYNIYNTFSCRDTSAVTFLKNFIDHSCS